MYVNKIDETIDTFIDDFYNKVIVTEVTKYYDEPNFVKYQKDINKLLVGYFDKIDKKVINDILNNEENTEKLIEYIKKYIAYYVMLMIGFFYKNKYETFMNNVIEFSKNQHGFNLKIDNFFNSESNAAILKFYSMVKNILIILDADSVKLAQITKKREFKDTIEFLNIFGQEYVDENFKLKNLHGKVNDQAHNIIKTIIISEIYIKQDKQDVHMFLEQSEIVTGEFIYIDVVVQTTDIIDYSMIESVLSKKEIDSGFAADIYELLTEYNTYKTEVVDHDKKIIELINSGMIIPVSEDFMLYHKDSENYDKYIGKLSTISKKKEEPKIKYIVNKIESISEYYSTTNNQEKLESIKKIFDPLLADRRGVVINHVEDVKILTKLELIGSGVIESNEYYNDLKNYMKYPYINFKNFKETGFSITTPKYVDTVRSISFENITELSKNKPLQIRSSNPNVMLHVTGFIIPNKFNDIKCAKIGNIVNIRNIKYKDSNKKIKNGYKTALNCIKKNILNEDLPPIYWKFNLEKDKVKFEKYDITSSLNNMEQTKMIIVKLYDDVIMSIMLILDDKFNKKLNNKMLTMQMCTKLLNQINHKLIDLSVNKEMYDEFIKKIYLEYLIKCEDRYDIKSDIFTGLTGNIIELPTYKPVKTSKLEIIKLPTNVELAHKMETKEQLQIVNAICQHNITWDNLMAIRKKEPNKFNDRLFAFFLQYVDKTYDNQYICKSCNALVNIGNFVQEGSYDEEGHFVSFNVSISVPLEDIPEYEKYKSSIRNLEKTVERFANIFKINSLVGGSNSIKIKIRQIIKDTIDLVLIHNINLKQIYKQRMNNLTLYGINKDLTNLFTFELDNSIFVYSSTDKDYYKSIKKNNIYIYLLFFIILELSDTQIIYMMGDKICNYYLFSKFGGNLFDGLNIKKGNGNNVTPIFNYKVLCYVLFYMSCLMTKYNLWFYEKVDEKKKFNPMIQKIIINTFVDFLNSVIEVYSGKNKKYIYDIVVNKFFQKLNSTFMNNDLLEKIKILEEKKTTDKKTKFANIQNEPIVLQHSYNPGKYFNDALWLTLLSCRAPKSYIAKYIKQSKYYYEISDITNCENGSFHKWELKNGEFVCSLCDRRALSKQGTVLTETIKSNYYTTILEKTAKKYCESGSPHNCIDGKCIACNVEIDKNTDKKKLQKIYNTVKKLKSIGNKQVNFNNFEVTDKNTKFINELKKEYGETKVHKEDYFKFISNFITKIEVIVGKDYNVGNQNIFLRYDTYIIDHDHNGYPITKPILIIDNSNKIIFKNNHPFFKTDVFYYTNNKLEIDIYYNTSTRLLLGYKEKNKEYQNSKKTGVYIYINYSILTMIKLFGYPGKVIKISDKMEEYETENKILGLENVIGDISKNRINILKKLLADFQRYIYRFAYNFYEIKTDTNIDTEEVLPYDFIEKYKNKVNKIILYNNDKKINKFLHKWKVVKDTLFFESIHNKIINIDPVSEIIDAEIVSNYDYSGNLLLFFLITELSNLLDANDDKFSKVNLAHLLLEMIITFHNELDINKLLENNEAKRFVCMLNLNDYAEIVEEYTVGFYSEYNDPEEQITKEAIEKNIDAVEENDALDMMEGDGDYDDTHRDFGPDM
jgi:hypothetical protein